MIEARYDQDVIMQFESAIATTVIQIQQLRVALVIAPSKYLALVEVFLAARIGAHTDGANALLREHRQHTAGHTRHITLRQDTRMPLRRQSSFIHNIATELNAKFEHRFIIHFQLGIERECIEPNIAFGDAVQKVLSCLRCRTYQAKRVILGTAQVQLDQPRKCHPRETYVTMREILLNTLRDGDCKWKVNVPIFIEYALHETGVIFHT
mmetsp:Transcript_28730/g.47100  ORF Transcript_28730/g.47100 Transcript_28730/m.47100 type:complete len:209 (-) Transcript_28730:197-823(-)